MSAANDSQRAKIKVLDAEMANQIAAGEVIENPASVVKELVENALDAGAGKITVSTEGSSTDCIRVIDDGEGMSPDDAMLALERHATSKVSHPEDLTTIDTLGFRGEALPSIASVSRVKLTTKEHGEVAGTQIVAIPGEELEVKPSGTPEGTRIEVRDLFFNTPARKKFLKSQSTETARITELVTRLALCKPDVAFTLVRNGKQLRSYLQRSTLSERVQEVVGNKVSLRAGSGGIGKIQVEAWLTLPESSRVGARGLHMLVNGRLIKDQALMRAIWYAYQGTLEQGHYPVGVVAVTMAPELLDVNVHPQKNEVRFADRGAVHGAVSRVVGTLLQDRPHYLGDAANASSTGSSVGGEVPLFPTSTSWPSTQDATTNFDSHSYAHGSSGVPSGGFSAPSSFSPGGETTGSYEGLRYLSSAGAAWLVCEGPEGLVIIDQHAAHERITFERLQESYSANKPKVQQLLVQEQVEVSPQEQDLLAENAVHLRAIGFEIEPFSTTSVSIAAVPASLSRADPRRLLDEVVTELAALQAPLSGAMDRLLARLACHGSVRGGTRLAREEVEALLADLDAAKLGGHCPHGRPVSLNLSWYEIERRLGRHK